MADRTGQIPLHLTTSAVYRPEDFFISDCNRAAMGFVNAWPDWPAPALIIHGPQGCGKTHMAHIWQQKTDGTFISSLSALQDACVQPSCYIIDDVSAFIGAPEAEQALFHLYNVLKEANRFMLLTAEDRPQDWDFVLPDLKSRLCAALAAGVQAPDDDLLSLLLMKLFSDRQILVSQEVNAFILARIDRSFAAVNDFAVRIDAQALAEKRAITIPLVRRLLQEDHS